jgi:two-component system OmpR family response regulator
MITAKIKKIFIVDDVEMLATALEDYITGKTPHKVKTFGTGEECLRNLDEEPDVIVLDYYLNTVQKDAANGMEILQHIKKNYPKIHIIMLSSQERYGLAMQTIQKGAEQYVIKDEDAFDKIVQMINEM